MSDTNISEQELKASDPNTPGLELQQLATDIKLRPLIAKNPAAYTGLLDWLIAKNEPEVLAALRERQQLFAAGTPMPMPTLAIPEDPPVTAPNPAESHAKSPELAAPSDPQNPDFTGMPNDHNPPVTETTAPATSPAATPDSPETPALPPKRTSILGGGGDQTTVLNVTAESAAAVSQSQLPPSYAPGSGTVTPDMTPFTASPDIPHPGDFPNSLRAEQTSATAPTVFLNQDSAPEPDLADEPKSNTALWIIFGFLLTVVIVLAVALILVFLGSRGGSANSETPTESSPASTSAATPPPRQDTVEPTKTPREETKETKETKAPAPAGAANTSALTTLSGNTTCAITGGKLTCMLKDHEATIADCGSETSVVVTLTDASPKVTCQPKDSYAPAGKQIQYDQSITFDDFACTSTHDYTECWNMLTGEAFRLARQDYQTFQR